MFLGNVRNNGPRMFLFGTIYKDIDALCKQFVAVDNIINSGMFVFTQLRQIGNDFIGDRVHIYFDIANILYLSYFF